MSRVKRGPQPRRRHKRVFKQVKGFWGGRKNRIRQAMRVLWKSWQYAYVGRKLKKRDFRRLWITRINAACRENGTTLFTLDRRAEEAAASSSIARCSRTWPRTTPRPSRS